MFSKKTAIVCAAAAAFGSICIGATPDASAATTFMNINFDGDTVGSAPVTNTSTALPLTQPYSIGGYDSASGEYGDNPPKADEGTILVSGASKNTTWTTDTSNNEVGALYLDTQYNVSTSKLSLSFDLNILSGSTLTGQDATLNTDSSTVHPLFGVNTFSNGTTLRFTATATSATGGVFGIRTLDGGGNSHIQPFYTYTNGDNHNVELDADYAAGTVSVLVDGISQLSNYSFSGTPNPAAALSESFFYLNGNTGDANSIALDNIVGVVPEPSSVAMFVGLGGLALLSRRSRRKIA